ncbi:MAG TPA: HIG1 domain-containing protein [Dongiaceae bacterium]|nr:HIG1 domain-containing protein [Allosphingosinicella sp.]HKP23550.1 HIG1 domain-containing protein [Dongiaceae bacterium]
MSVFLLILVVLFALATLFVLIKGVVGMAQGKDVTGQRSQDLMRKRVMLQAVAIIFVILFLFVAGASRH